MFDFTFNDLLTHLGATKNMRQNGCILVDMDEVSIRELEGQPFRMEGGLDSLHGRRMLSEYR